MERDFQTELKAAQGKVKALGAQREKLVGDERVAESRVTQAVEALKALGIEDAGELSIEALRKLQETEQAKLVTNLDSLQAQITAAEGVMAEYATVQG